MRKLIKCVKRLWIIGTCNHKGNIEFIDFGNGNGPILNVCKKCGRVINGLPYKNEVDNYNNVTC